jgi:hypothetical protein
MSAIDDINTAMDAATQAVTDGDYATALRKTEIAWMRLIQLPDSEFQDERLQWDRERMREMLDYLQRKANSQTLTSDTTRVPFIRTVDIKYENG